ncbi:ApbE-like lipoprotein [Moraxella macacae 0408225]|uniref:FAD:protein FMN transferase n=1 Tax=Moraxella macacae 0408225 TaxID=1230338 RepID=L2F8D3_9GAMM|nr:FAD:protein FMN transferase [Moraxella macacae]ELA09026.1 ApbE-like lipoprotein [Moraxella macacae 0408225]
MKKNSNVALSVGLVLCLAVGVSACQKPPKYQNIEGKTMGTSYHISFEMPKDADVASIQASIDKRLLEINQSMSTYDDTATIMAFNRAKVGEQIQIDPDFIQVLTDAKQIYQASNGAFDPTVMPLVSLWGFGKEMRIDRLQSPPTTAEIDNARRLIDFDSVVLQGNRLSKNKAEVALDFSAIAKGYGVDVVADVLKSDYKINNYMVEIGGEVATFGKNAKGQAWQLGIDEPVINSSVSNRNTIAIIRESKLGKINLATSGNYRNSLVYDGVRYSHTIDPKTGSPVVNGASSVTVVHDTTALADAWATALTAMPYDKALKTAQDNNLAVLFIVHKFNIHKNMDAHSENQQADWQIVETQKMKALREGN